VITFTVRGAKAFATVALPVSVTSGGVSAGTLTGMRSRNAEAFARLSLAVQVTVVSRLSLQSGGNAPKAAPVGRTRVTVLGPVAIPGPLLVTRRRNVPLPPGITPIASAEMARSLNAVTFVPTDPRAVPIAGAVTVAILVSVLPVADSAMVPEMTSVIFPCAGMVAVVAMSAPIPDTAPQLAPTDPVQSHVATMTPPGTGTDRTAPDTSAGPLFVTTTV
jgi:hypothetical protein